MSTLAIRLLGPPEIERGGVVVAPPRGHKAWAVLAYLVLAERPVARARLADLVFGEADDPLGALRWTLAQLRRALGFPDALRSDPLDVGLPEDTMVDVLVLSSGDSDPALARGGLLEGIDPRAGAVFDAWLMVERRRLAGVCEAVLRDAALGALAAGDALDAAALASRAVALDAFDESAHELLVRCLARAGEIGAARHQANACEVLFRRELGRTPDPRVRRAADEHDGRGETGGGDRSAALGQLEAGRAAVAAGAVEPGVACLRQACAEARQMAHVTALAAARHRVLASAGHDVERDGIAGAPRIRVLAGDERHVTVDRALRLLGLGTGSVEPVATDGRGAMRADRLASALAQDDDRPTIVVAQAGNVNGGAIDPLEQVCAAARAAGAWVHIDAAFGLWAAASPSQRRLVRGIELADSWATDAHKWLNVPYDCGIVFVADRQAHRAAISVTAAYLVQDGGGPREPMDWTPEFSRRARGLAVYATLRALGRAGVAELVDRLCACAERFAHGLGDAGFEVLHQELNQVLVACESDAATDATLAAVQADGTCYPSGTTWRNRRCLRLSVCNWQTTPHDVDKSVAAIAAAVRGVTPRA